MKEEWKPYPNDNDYLVSNTGNVKGPKGTILKGSITTAGYRRIGLYHNGKGTFKFVHRMVLETFAPRENMEQLVVNHKDGNKLNNSLDNLEWCTQQENLIHARDTLKIKYNTEAAHEAAKKSVKMIDVESKEEKIFNSIKECAEFVGVTYQTIQYYIKTQKPYKKLNKIFKSCP